MNRQDSRFIESEKRIKEAFYTLLSRKPIEKIRTQDIIASADINKSTFYSHYRDKYDLLDSLVNDAAELLSPALEKVFSIILDENVKQSDIDAAYSLFDDSFNNHKDFFRIVIGSNSGSALASKLSDLIEHIWNEKKIADPSVVYYSYLINAITYIIVGTTEKWVKRNCVDPSEDLMRLAHDVGIGVHKALTRNDRILPDDNSGNRSVI